MSWVLAFLGFAVLIILHEAGHFAAAKAVGMRVEKFYLFFPPKAFSFTRGETEYGIGLIPLGGFVRITGMNPNDDEGLPDEVLARGYYRQPVWKRLVVIGAGPAVNIILAFVMLFFIFNGFGLIGDSTRTVKAVESDSPAHGKLLPGDEILSVDGIRGTPVQFRKEIQTHHCKGMPSDGCMATEPVHLLITRDGKRMNLSVTPRYDANSKSVLIGFRFDVEQIDIGPGESLHRSIDAMWTVTSGTVSTIGQLFKSEKRKEVSGIVGTYETTRQTIEFDTKQALFLLAIVSLSLGVLNLFPFLPLDGGHMLWSIIEKVRGRPVPFSILERASLVGIFLVLILFVIGFTNDIGRLTGEGFGVR